MPKKEAALFQANDDVAQLQAELQWFLIEEELYTGTTRRDVAAGKVAMILNRIEVLGQGRFSRGMPSRPELLFFQVSPQQIAGTCFSEDQARLAEIDGMRSGS